MCLLTSPSGSGTSSRPILITRTSSDSASLVRSGSSDFALLSSFGRSSKEGSVSRPGSLSGLGVVLYRMGWQVFLRSELRFLLFKVRSERRLDALCTGLCSRHRLSMEGLLKTTTTYVFEAYKLNLLVFF